MHTTVIRSLFLMIVAFTILPSYASAATSLGELKAQLKALIIAAGNAELMLPSATINMVEDMIPSIVQTFSTDIGLEARGARVTVLQLWLIKQGHDIPAGATGFFGPQTQAALAAYQASNAIELPNGVFNAQTRAFLAQ